MKVTLFNNFSIPAEDLDIYDVFKTIKSDKYASEIKSIRLAYHNEDKKLGDTLKKQLPAFTPSGTFTYRNAQSLAIYNQIIHLDFDHLADKDLKAIVQKINNCSYTFASFISPSGKGIKVFIKVSSTAKEHLASWSIVKDFYFNLIGIEADISCKDISRLCFFSHDESLFLNEKSDPLNFSQYTKPSLIDDPKMKTLEECFDFTNLKSKYTEGNRNNYVYLFSCNANRFGITQAATLNYLINKFTLDKSEINSSVLSAYNNISEASKFETASTQLSLTKSKDLHFRTIEEMISRNQSEPPIPYLYSGIKLGSFGFIFGPSKSGKTTYAENLAISIATGQTTFFNKALNVGAKKVLFISMEEYWQPRTERNEKQLKEIIGDKNNYCTVDENFPRLIDSDDDWKLLREHIIKSEADVVFIDSLTRIMHKS